MMEKKDNNNNNNKNKREEGLSVQKGMRWKMCADLRMTVTNDLFCQ